MCQRNLEGPETHSLLRTGEQAFEEFGFRLFFASWLLGTCVDEEVMRRVFIGFMGKRTCP